MPYFIIMKFSSIQSQVLEAQMQAGKRYHLPEMRLHKFQSGHKKISSIELTLDNLQLSHEAEVFDILEQQGEQQIYSNPWMNCTSMGEYSDVLSAHDWWKDGRQLKQMEHVRSGDIWFAHIPGQPEIELLDMGFLPRHNVDQPSTPPSISVLDMGFPPGSELDTHQAPDIINNPLDMGFCSIPAHDYPAHDVLARDGPAHDGPVQSLDMQVEQIPLNMGFHTDLASCHSLDIQPDDLPLDMGFDTLQPDNRLLHTDFNALQPDEHPLDMGFCTLHPVHPDHSMDIQLSRKPLDMGFGTAPASIQEDRPLDIIIATPDPDPVHGLPDPSFAVGEPAPIGFVIQHAYNVTGRSICEPGSSSVCQ
ncbi:uncharacterized protein EDB93DRAFT_1252585 [Suillus bovinus]|uniref:uncharacterized protein n=1 Tax=Suillus bovinus TaxID=48563 RepID=UPI001B880246|nr:uncharacterized protein EDB93DRAFT_1252585 [Suillus bovinus]KAG2141444.1 hypothetical protein EDB93DRAFT_1252585 [Suillus bovinus]